jgi:hypothetical protein
MKLDDLKVMSYELELDKDTDFSISLECVPGIGCERWAIRWAQNTLGKTPVNGFYLFSHEPLPSSRDDAYYKEYRWKTAQKALLFWLNRRSHIVATSRERREFARRTRATQRR